MKNKKYFMEIGHKKDQFFVATKTMNKSKDRPQYTIVDVFYNQLKCEEAVDLRNSGVLG